MAKYGKKEAKMKRFFFDKENDILTIHNGFSSDEKFKGNIDAGEIVFDVSTKGRIRGIEIMKASSFLKEFDISSLENLSDAEFNASSNPNGIVLGLTMKLKNIKKEIPAKIVVPLERPICR